MSDYSCNLDCFSFWLKAGRYARWRKLCGLVPIDDVRLHFTSARRHLTSSITPKWRVPIATH
jgi:hypothetical protein